MVDAVSVEDRELIPPRRLRQVAQYGIEAGTVIGIAATLLDLLGLRWAYVASLVALFLVGGVGMSATVMLARWYHRETGGWWRRSRGT